MSRKTSQAKLRTLIRKVVKEELNKMLTDDDSRHLSVPDDSFAMDPRFSPEHETADHGGIGEEMNEAPHPHHSAHPFAPPHPLGAFGPPPQPPAPDSSEMEEPPHEANLNARNRRK